MSPKHLSEDRLVDICLAGALAPEEESHLIGCSACALRRLSFEQMLDEVDIAADIDVDALFPAERQAKQRARILQRLEQEGRPGRLLSFPPAQVPLPVIVHPRRPRVRWAAAAIAASFLVGMVAGHLAHDLPSGRDPSAPRVVANDRDAAPLRAVPTTWSDEEFLAQIEQAAFRVSPAALGPLDEMTPRAWEVGQ